MVKEFQDDDPFSPPFLGIKILYLQAINTKIHPSSILSALIPIFLQSRFSSNRAKLRIHQPVGGVVPELSNRFF